MSGHAGASDRPCDEQPVAGGGAGHADDHLQVSLYWKSSGLV